MRNEIVKKLLVRAPNWIGDAVMSEPAVAALRRAWPDAEVTLLAKPAVAELLRGHPGLDRILVYESPGRHRGLLGKWRLAARLRRERFDAAVLLQNAFEAALLVWLARIPRRRGFATDGRGWLLSDPVALPKNAAELHQADYFFTVVEPLAPGVARPAPRLYLGRDEEHALAEKLRAVGVADCDVLVGVNPGSTYGRAKRWLPERFAAVSDRLADRVGAEQGAPVRVVIVGARGEEEVGEIIAGHMTHPPVRLAGLTTVRELMGVVKRCRIFITNDTGPMHVAAAFGVPVVAVFGPTDHRTTAPAGGRYELVRHPVDCAPCLLRDCPIDHRCMTRVTTEDVYEAALRLEAGHEASDRQPGGAPPLRGVTVFLDRDGTLNKDPGYLGRPEDLELFPGTAEAVARLNRAGAAVVLVTNQSGVGRGLFSMDDLTRIHDRLRELLAQAGGRLDGIYYCPHHPEEGCACRKPGTALIEQAVAELHLDRSRSYVVGDQDRDMELAHRIGARGVRVTTGSAGPGLGALEEADFCAADLSGAVEWILQDALAQARAGKEVSG